MWRSRGSNCRSCRRRMCSWNRRRAIPGPAIGLVAAVLQRRCGDCMMATFAADHTVQRPEAFEAAVRLAAEVVAAEPEALATIGIRPTRPETGFGYIEVGDALEGTGPAARYRVRRFVEKPDRENGRAGYWRAAGFCGTPATSSPIPLGCWICMTGICRRWARRCGGSATPVGTPEEARRHPGGVRPAPQDRFRPGDRRAGGRRCGWCPRRWAGVMSEAGSCSTSSWRSSRGRPFRAGRHVGLDDQGCLVMAGDRLVATLGLQDVVVVDTGDALLVMNKARAQEVKQLMDRLRAAGEEAGSEAAAPGLVTGRRGIARMNVVNSTPGAEAEPAADGRRAPSAAATAAAVFSRAVLICGSAGGR